jgi:hypothetical protein
VAIPGAGWLLPQGSTAAIRQHRASPDAAINFVEVLAVLDDSQMAPE